MVDIRASTANGVMYAVCLLGLPGGQQMKLTSIFFLVLSFISGWLLIADDTYAEDAAGPSAAVLEEILVTARRKEESLQNVPMSVTAFSGADIEARGILNLSDVALSVPNVNFSKNIGIAVVSIRGIADEDLLVTADPLVGIYVDGVYLARLQGGFLDIVDAERIEVLKGPQGTLFGKNTIGGAINIVSKVPEGEGTGYVKAQAGEDGRFNLQGLYDFGVHEDLSVTINGMYKSRGCLVRRESDDACLDDEDVRLIRAYANYQPNDGFRAALILDGTWDDSHSQVMGITAYEPAGLFEFFYDLDRLGDPTLPPYAPVGLDKYSVTDGNAPTDERLRSYGVALQLEWALSDSTTLRSTTAYRDFEAIAFIEFDNFAATIFQNDGFETFSETFSQELILEGSADRLEWLLGAYYFGEDGDNNSKIRVANSFATGGWNQFISSEVDSISGFAHLSFSVTDRVRLSGGARYTSEDREFSAAGDLVGLPPGNRLFQPLVGDDGSWDAWSPKVTLDFTPTDSMLVYGTVSRGFRSGGFNGNTTSSDPDLNRYDPEFVTNYEIGLKANWSRRVTLDAAVYYMKYKDKQFSFQIAQPGGAPVAVKGNAAAAELIGVEVGLRAALTEYWLLEVGFAYNDSEYTKVRDDALGLRITLDSPFQYAPKRTANLSLQYLNPDLGGVGAASFRVDAAYKSRIYYNTVRSEIEHALFGPSNFQDDYVKLNARINFAPHNANWSTTLYAVNLTNKVVTDFNLGIPGFSFDRASYGQPREVGIEVRYDFD